MSKQHNDPMQEMFIFETAQQLEQLEQSVINAESEDVYCDDTVDEIFRIMHTIKGSAAMMLYNSISTAAHLTEDLFYCMREDNPKDIDVSSLCDIVLEAVDFMKIELEKIKNSDPADGEPDELTQKVEAHLSRLKQNGNREEICIHEEPPAKKQFYISAAKESKPANKNLYKAVIRFQEGCEMENIRAFTIIHSLKEITQQFKHLPEDIINDDNSSEIIREDGFTIYLKTDKSYDFVENFFMEVVFLEHLDLVQLENEEEYDHIGTDNEQGEQVQVPDMNEVADEKDKRPISSQHGHSMISVDVERLDKLMDLVGEMVIAEAMVTQNPDLEGLTLDNFDRAARQLTKITSEVQDTVMAIRMVPLGPTFFKMNRIVRDMSKRLNKQVDLDIVGEATEVDKNIIERISDPLIHLVRNALDHGIETTAEREAVGKPPTGTITLEARNAGSEVLIMIRDDGRGLDKESLLQRAMNHGLLTKSLGEMTDTEIYNLILTPGFSTNEAVTEFSGRGVGMDVVSNNIEAIGGSVQVNSHEGKGTTITLKIPLTLAIIEGMNIRVGSARYTIPTMSIRESFRPVENDVFTDTDDNEMIMIRGECYKVVRLHELYHIETEVTKLEEGILIMVESETKAYCLFADELLGQQQVVVKSLPQYIQNIKKINGVSGCTLLGDANISLILDIEGIDG